jgi:hypothetical protein
MGRENQTSQRMKEAQGIGNPLGKRLYDLKEAARYLGRSVWSVRELIWDGLLPIVRPEGKRKIYVDILDLQKFVDLNKSIYQ